MDSRNLLCGHCGPRIATLSCQRCNLPLCSECRVEERCPACARELLRRRRLRRGLMLALLAGFIPGVIMTAVAGVVLKRAIYRHQCQRSVMELRRELRLMQHRLIARPAVRPNDDPVPIKLDLPSVRGAEPRAAAAPIRRAGPGRYVVQRRGVARILSGTAGLGHARVVPVTRDGRPQGFKVYRIRAQGPLYKLGLRNGDLIRRVNGALVDTPDKALTIYNRIRLASRITLQLVRRGKGKTLRYWITDEAGS